MYGLGHKLAGIFLSVIIVENPSLFSLILELCLLFLTLQVGISESAEICR